MSINNITVYNDQEDLEGDIFFYGHDLNCLLPISTTRKKKKDNNQAKILSKPLLWIASDKYSGITCTISDRNYSFF